MKSKIVTLDLREDIRSGREPFRRIMETVAGLGAADALRLIAPFEPVPLFHVLGQRGFSHQAKPMESGDWEVLFQRTPAGTPTARTTTAVSQSPEPPSAIDVDARGLEPPQPLVVILEAAEALPPGVELRAHTDRRPMHLHAQLDERGFIHQSRKQSDGSFITHIRRP